MDADTLLVRVTESQCTFPHRVDRAPTVRPQSICQSLTVPIWLATATTVRLGKVGFWMGGRQNARMSTKQVSSNLICSRFVTTMILSQPNF